ncbi:MAG: CutA1 divalent ion tolerance protein [Thermoplasmatales archaeon]|jgi:periplasmic divalent cation tolerance protein|nr:CutA1 divalent ion tolerance protein [Thermoplasmatales archaeon]
MSPVIFLIQILKIILPIGVFMVSVIYSTTDTLETARTIARCLVTEKLVACVHILPKIESIYRWQGKIEEATEYVLLAKTMKRNIQQTIQRIRTLHPYEVPEILVLPAVGGLKEYLEYVDVETL